MCGKCRLRHRYKGTLPGAPKCGVERCERTVSARGLCHMHWRRRKKGQTMCARPLRTPRGVACKVEGCERAVMARAMCRAHHARWMKGTDVTTPIRPSSLGNRMRRHVNVHGYVMVYDPEHPNALSSGNIAEHRRIMAESLGRPLLPGENVHHKNGVRADNRLVKGHEYECLGTCCNLELWSTSQPHGQRALDKVAWAREILRVYADDLSRMRGGTGT
jgi:hypothetical protein